MPRYFFHVQDGETYTDLQGMELPDLPAARRESVRFAAALLADHSEKFWDHGEWSMRVADGSDLTLFSLTFLAVSSPAGSNLVPAELTNRG